MNQKDLIVLAADKNIEYALTRISSHSTYLVSAGPPALRLVAHAEDYPKTRTAQKEMFILTHETH